MSRWLCIVGRWLWIACAIVVLLVTLKVYDGSPKSDAEILLLYGMQVLSFPIGILVSLGLGGVSELFNLIRGTYLYTSYASITLAWSSYFLAGYWQWFKATPWLYRKAQARIVAWRKTKNART